MAEKTVTQKIIAAQEIPGNPNPKHPDNKNWFLTCEKDGKQSSGHYWGSKDWSACIGKEVEMIVDTGEPKGKAQYKIKLPRGGGGGWGGGKAYNPTPEQQMRMAAIQAACQLSKGVGTKDAIVGTAQVFYEWIKG